MTLQNALHAPPFYAEHIGSLLRPKFLLEKRGEYFAHKSSIKVAEEAAIKDVVEMQIEAGIKGITDGELRRHIFHDGVFESLEGMNLIPNASLKDMVAMFAQFVGRHVLIIHFSYTKTYVLYISQMYDAGVLTLPSYYCSGKIKRRKGIYTSDFEYMKSLLPPDQVKNAKVTICPPEWMHIRHGPEGTYDKSVYKNDAEYFSDLTQAYREEIQDLYDLGCRNIQFDEPSFCFFLSETMNKGLTAQGRDANAVLNQYIQVINDCLRAKPADMNVGVHMCRGNYRGMHFSEGGYDRIAKIIFLDLNVNCYYMEYDNDRSGTFEPLQHLPRDKIVVLGLVTTKTGNLESESDLKKRIYEAAEWIRKGDPTRTLENALAQLRLGTQCEFASTVEGNPITEEDEKKKLELLVRVAKDVWPTANV